MLEPDRFSLDQNRGAPIFFRFDAFILREPVSTPDQVQGHAWLGDAPGGYGNAALADSARAQIG
jgi:hypothetical protein